MTEPTTPRHVLDRFGEHASEIGHLVYASARLQWSLGQLFAALVGTRKPISIAIWYSLKSDRSQRDILEAAAKVALANHADAKSDVLWLLAEADARAIDRNDAVHTAFFFTINDDGEIVPVPDAMSSPGRLQRLTDSELPLSGVFAACHGSLTAFIGTPINSPISSSWLKASGLHGPKDLGCGPAAALRTVREQIVKPLPNNVSPRFDHLGSNLVIANIWHNDPLKFGPRRLRSTHPNE